MRHLVMIGACYLDTILTVSHYPREDEKLRASSISRRRGGNTLNSLDVLAQLLEFRAGETGATTAPLHAVAILPARSSPAIKEIQDSLGPSVDLSRCFYREGCTEPASSYIIKSRETSSRTVVNYNELPEMTVDEFVGMTHGLPSGRRMWFHFEGRIPDVTLECIRHIREVYDHDEAMVSVEVEKPAREGLRELAAEADVVFYSKTWAQDKGFDSPEEFLHAQSHLTPKASILFCTWGGKGAVSLDRRSMNCIQTPAFTDAQRPVVDTIGAGDTFIAGILYQYICHEDDFDLQKALAFANELAGRKVAQEGFEGLAKPMARYM